ncbi:MAG TPA: GNAT family N-acetyltransferase [Pyrinomonadaceae bacterium]|nr:GNAT family N-acetyltransferase [Pyrinomonadaceae bacterium]
MLESIIIEQMKLSEKDKVLAFLKTVYADNPRQSDIRFWDWHFLEPPHAANGHPPVWLARSGDRIAGQLGAIPVEMNVDGEKRSAIWILDLIVDPDFRRMGIAQKLVIAAREFCPFLLGINTNKQHAPAMLKKLGFVIVTKIPRFHKILFPGEALPEITSLGPLRTAANLAFAPFRAGLKDPLKRGEEVRQLRKFDSSFDELWHESSGQWACSVSRSAAMLNWQFKQQPDKRFEILGHYENDKLLGYAILFFRRANAAGAIDKAAISDICYHPRKAAHTVDTLLQASLRIALDRRAGSLVTDAHDTLLQQRLKYFGFWPVTSGLQLMALSPEREELIYDESSWFLTRGDADISIFEHANV